MAYFSLHAYDADVWIREFKGLDQGEEGLNPDPCYAAEAVNVETPGGVLQPKSLGSIVPGAVLDEPIETLACFHRRWFETTETSGSKNFLVAASGGKLYYMQEDGKEGWMEIKTPDDFPNGFACNTWSWVTYEYNIEGVDHPIDILIMSNKQDGMIMVIPAERFSTWFDHKDDYWPEPPEEGSEDEPVTWEDMESAEWTINTIDTNPGDDPVTGDPRPDYKFGVIERFQERIWGGDVEGEPDMLVYSRPYNPWNWTEAGQDEQPENGAGTIQQPSWDGDRFTTLKAFGDQLLAFKEHRIWRVMGTNPGEFTMKEQYGDGAPFPKTVAVDVEKVYMADEDGISVYDGMSVTPFLHDTYKKIWRTVNKNALDKMCAALYNHKYYLCFPTGESEVNNAMLVYNFDDRTMLYYDDEPHNSILATYEYLYDVRMVPDSTANCLYKMGYDSWNNERPSGAATKWVSPWMDFGYKRIVKGGFELYFIPQVAPGESTAGSVTFIISVETEKKTKTKTYTVEGSNKEPKAKRLHFSGGGRRFRVKIETEQLPNGKRWRLLGGIQMVVETDPD